MKGSSGAVLLAAILPTLVTKLIAPFFMHRLPYWCVDTPPIRLAFSSLLL